MSSPHKALQQIALSADLHPFKAMASFYPAILASFFTGDNKFLFFS